MKKYFVLAAAVSLASLLACGGDSPTGPTRRTENFSGSLDDPTRCTCGNGINQYTIQPTTAGLIEATATVVPADAQLVVRLLDSTFNTVFVVSTRTGNTARFSFEAPPATYRVQVFLASDGPRQATFNLAVTYP